MSDASEPVTIEYERRGGGGRRVRVVPRVVPPLALLCASLAFPLGVAVTSFIRDRYSPAGDTADRAGFLTFASLELAAVTIGAFTWRWFRRPCTAAERTALRVSRVAVVVGTTGCAIAALVLLAGGVR